MREGNEESTSSKRRVVISLCKIGEVGSFFLDAINLDDVNSREEEISDGTWSYQRYSSRRVDQRLYYSPKEGRKRRVGRD